MRPIVDGLIDEYKNKVTIYYVDVEKPEFSELISAFRINAVPTFAFVNSDGTLNDYYVGSLSREELKQKIEELK